MRWRGRDGKYYEQVANACDDFVDLTPVSLVPAAEVLANFWPLTAGQEIPLIGEHSYGGYQEDDGCPREG